MFEGVSLQLVLFARYHYPQNMKTCLLSKFLLFYEESSYIFHFFSDGISSSLFPLTPGKCSTRSCRMTQSQSRSLRTPRWFSLTLYQQMYRLYPCSPSRDIHRFLFLVLVLILITIDNYHHHRHHQHQHAHEHKHQLHISYNVSAKEPIFRCPKMGLRAPESKNWDHFYKPNIPRNDGIAFGFILSICHFWNIVILGCFLAIFILKSTWTLILSTSIASF